jgi:hypothetical protein
MKHEAEFKEYVEKVKERLAYGEDKYGDRMRSGVACRSFE